MISDEISDSDLDNDDNESDHHHRSLYEDSTCGATPQASASSTGMDGGLEVTLDLNSQPSAEAAQTTTTSCTLLPPKKTTRDEGVQTDLAALPIKELYGKYFLRTLR